MNAGRRKRDVWLTYRFRQEDGFRFPRLSLFQEKNPTCCQDFKSSSSQAILVHPGRIIPSCFWMNITHQYFLRLNNLRIRCITSFTPPTRQRQNFKRRIYYFWTGKKEKKDVKIYQQSLECRRKRKMAACKQKKKKTPPMNQSNDDA